jgi:type 2 lantibiotic biosynthesis protein LanM
MRSDHIQGFSQRSLEWSERAQYIAELGSLGASYEDLHERASRWFAGDDAEVARHHLACAVHNPYWTGFDRVDLSLIGRSYVDGGQEFWAFDDFYDALVLSQARPELALLSFAWPLVTYCTKRACEGIEIRANTNELSTALLIDLLSALFPIAETTLALELAVYRFNGQDEADSFLPFAAAMCNRNRVFDLFDQYPVLARLMCERSTKWLSEIASIVSAIRLDIAALESLLQKPCISVSSISTSIGDHHLGRSVARVSIEEGGILYFKPRESSFDDLLDSCAAIVETVGFAIAPVVPSGVNSKCGTYHWHLAVEPLNCELAELPTFYKNAGALLALVYVLGLTDVHCENVIGVGARLVVVDTESALDRCPQTDLSRPVNWLADTVLSTGFLPDPVLHSDGSVDDFSVFGSDVKEMSQPRPGWRWTATGKDQLTYVFGDWAVHQPSAHLPLSDSSVQDALDHCEELCQGFRLGLAALSSQSAAIITRSSVRRLTRILLRNTWEYSEMLKRSFHPKNLRSGLDRDMSLAALWSDEATPRPARSHLEHCAMLRMDIPLVQIETSSGVATVDGQVATDVRTMGNVQARLANKLMALPDDVDRQCLLIETSLAAAAASVPSGERGRLPKPLEMLGRDRGSYHAPQLKPATRDPTAEADRIGRWLQAAASLSTTEARWLGLRELGPRRGIGPIGWDLYSGLAGISLFLIELYNVTGERYAADLSKAAFRAAMSDVAIAHESNTRIGLFDGWCGMAYAAARIGRVLGEERYLEFHTIAVERVAHLLSSEQQSVLDVVSGSAGVALGLLSLWPTMGGDVLEQALLMLGESIHSNVTRFVQAQGQGFSAVGEMSLAGVAHGSSGIALALEHLGHHFGNSEWVAVAKDALVAEERLYSVSLQNFIDLREPDSDDPLFGWCHGLPGSLLVRLRSKSGISTETLQRFSLDLVAQAGRGFRDDSLCHGSSGIAEVAAACEAAGLWPDFAPRPVDVLFGGSSDSWRCGFFRHPEVPSLGVGLAGIGYQCLRLSEPQKVPSLLSVGAS